MQGGKTKEAHECNLNQGQWIGCMQSKQDATERSL